MCFARRSAALAALLPLLVLAACATGDVTRPPADQASLIVQVNLSGTAVATVVVEVSAPDIPAPLVFNIPVAAGAASGTITIPVGSNRIIAIKAFNGTGVETHSGSTTISVQAGTNPSVFITLTPLTGDVPIEATLGSFTITVTPTPSSLSLIGTATVQLTAIVRDAHNQTVIGTVSWATRDPGVASVSAGLVTAVGVGQTSIFATFQGAVGSAAITVGP